MLTADISVERFRAKKDVAYEKYKVGAQKEMQDMKETIALSAERTGILNKEIEDAHKLIEELKASRAQLEQNLAIESGNRAKLTSLESNTTVLSNNLNKATEAYSKLSYEHEALKSQLHSMTEINKVLEKQKAELESNQISIDALKVQFSSVYQQKQALEEELSKLKGNLSKSSSHKILR